MIRATAILATAASVLWHAVVGCCAHHDHADCAPSSPAVAAAHAADAHDDCDEHRHEHDDEQRHHDDHDSPAPCDGEQCSFAVAKIIKAVELNFEPADCAAIGDDLVARAAKPIAGRLGRVGDDRSPPLRSHLALGVLLI